MLTFDLFQDAVCPSRYVSTCVGSDEAHAHDHGEPYDQHRHRHGIVDVERRHGLHQLEKSSMPIAWQQSNHRVVVAP